MKKILALLCMSVLLIPAYALAADINGTSGDDTLLGTPDADKIWGLAGNDQIGGFAGDDVILAGGDNDYVKAGPGDDTIYGGQGNDTLYGGVGYDTAVFKGLSTQYTWGETGGGWFQITGPDGTDAMYSIEHIAFEDIQGFDLEVVPVVLSSLHVLADNGTITLQWITGSESENLGFHVYRSLTVGGEYERLTSSIIEGAGSSPTTSTYEFMDGDAQLGQMYLYKLEQINFDGSKEIYEVVHLGVEDITAVQPNTWGTVKSLLK
jgi:hypothetical protein